MKVVGMTALLYGKDYLGWAIRSIIDHVDEHHIIYSPIGAHGHRTSTPCPETRDELYTIAAQAAGDKLRWHDGEWPHEGAQRDSIHEYAPDADVIIVLDADEIWPEVPDYPNGLRSIFESAAHQNRYKRFRWPMVHFWRSFYRAVLHDPAYPERIIVPGNIGNEVTVFPSWVKADGNVQRPIAHLGYAQRSEIVEYKILTHGHRNEWRKDVDWFRDRFMANAQTDCHPVGSEYWNPERVDPLDYMPTWMQEHQYYHKGIIE